MTGSVDDRVSMSALRERAPGTAYVESVQAQESECLVTLRYSSGERVAVTMPWAPEQDDQALPSSLGHALAVQVRNLSSVECSVLGTSTTGPKRVPISLTHAVALAGSGVHTVFFTNCASSR